ncbi:MAG: NFACT RNA binding domain-containing protein [Spirochaetaceae bacterium]|jgi:predicted ribosome quality control (RQC) complex YloA/Tae2 family protein|nr:NFACT RNA binding domain-containing protein [Spirochaetaceae bacterium]
MSLNWKEIDLILSELDLAGSQIQKIIQSGFDTLAFRLYCRGRARSLLVVIRGGVCRLHETFRDIPPNDKPLRFCELLKSRILNGRIEEAVQLGCDRIVRCTIRRGERRFLLYFRLWSNAANVMLCEPDGRIIDAMRRLPKRGEKGGGYYRPERSAGRTNAPYGVRELEGEGSFNEKIDRWYAEQGGVLSLEALRAEAVRRFEGGIMRLEAALSRLCEKEAACSDAERLKEYGDIIMANISLFKPERSGVDGAAWIEADDFYSGGGPIRISVDPEKGAAENAAAYYGRYRKAKSGLDGVRAAIAGTEAEIVRQKDILERLLSEQNPFRLKKRIDEAEREASPRAGAATDRERKRSGLLFRRGDWLMIAGRTAKENDELLRRHVNGNDLWLHARDFAGAYIFVKRRSGKTVPLPALLDAANLALFYSKGRNSGSGEIFYTQVKHLRRAKNGPKGLVIPAQEKTLSVKLEEWRLRELEACRE